jgi:dUTP pyrophosphatase
MEQVTINLDNNNICNSNIMNIAIVCNDTDIIEFYENQINVSHNSNESGFDLVVTEDVELTKDQPTKLLPLGIKCSPQFNAGYFLCPRSSIFKTPIRMANSIGIIDMTYRGEIKAPVDFNSHLCNTDSYIIKKGTKLFQLCKATLEPIMYNKIDESELSITNRGIGGFGSTGISIV